MLWEIKFVFSDQIPGVGKFFILIMLCKGYLGFENFGVCLG